MKKSCYVILAAAIVLSGCAIQRSMDASSAQKKMIGMNQEDVLACMGVPSTSGAVGSTEAWSYISGDGRRIGSASDSQGRSCTVNINFQQKIVRSVNYAGPTGGLLTQGEQCAYVIQNCIGR